MQSSVEEKGGGEPVRISYRKRHKRPPLDPEVDPIGLLGLRQTSPCLFHWFGEGVDRVSRGRLWFSGHKASTTLQ